MSTLTFEAWWVAERGHPPTNDIERAEFSMAHLAWRGALARGQIEQPTISLQGALGRVERATCTAEDARVIYEYLAIQTMSIEHLEAQLANIEAQADAYAEYAGQLNAEREAKGIPEGGIPMGGTRWRCPRCSFIAGNVRHEPTCRACNFPAEDTRDWYNEDGTEKDVAP